MVCGVAASVGLGVVVAGAAGAQPDPVETSTSTTSTTEATTTSTTEPSTTTTEAPTTTVPPDPEPTSPPTTAPAPTTTVVVPTTEAEVGRVVTEGTVLRPATGQGGGAGNDAGGAVAATTSGGWFTPANQVRMAVATLVALAVVMAVLTVAYWRHTRPDSVPPLGGVEGDDDPASTVLSAVGPSGETS